jgi:hypothetical protein
MFPARDKKLFSSSGTIVEIMMSIGYVVTYASLVKLPHKDELAGDLKVVAFFFSFPYFYGVIVLLDNEHQTLVAYTFLLIIVFLPSGDSRPQ